MPRLCVVAAAIVRDGRVLAARRSRPAELAGRWEFPGGKVEDGETPEDALARECREELDVTVTVGTRLADADDGRVALTLFAATLADGPAGGLSGGLRGEPAGGRPRAGETHDALRWLDAAALGCVDWLPIDDELLPAVRAMLGRTR